MRSSVFIFHRSGEKEFISSTCAIVKQQVLLGALRKASELPADVQEAVVGSHTTWSFLTLGRGGSVG